MERRDFVKTLPVVALAGAAAQNSDAQAAAAQAGGTSAADSAQAKGASDQEGVRQLLSKKPGTPDYVEEIAINCTE